MRTTPDAPRAVLRSRSRGRPTPRARPARGPAAPSRLLLLPAGALVLARAFGALAAPPVPALRLVLEYDRGAVRVLEQVPIEKALPPTDALAEGASEHTGAWFELRADDGSLLYRRVVRDPLVQSVEFQGADGRMERIEAAPTRQVFSVVIPRPARAAELRLFGRPTTAGARDRAPSAASREVARVPIVPGSSGGRP